jgi:N-acetylneuraminate synthase/sialic acid synthase
MSDASLTLNGRRIALDAPAYICAEIGHNHGGSVDSAIQHIEAAASAGVDAVKFQKRDNPSLYTRALLEQPYEHEHSYGSTYGKHREALELTFADLMHCQTAARAQHVTLFSTAFDAHSADLCATMGMPAIKIASGDLTNTPLLRHVAQLGRPIILSTGGGTFEDIDRAVEAVTRHTHELALLHCTAAYPVRDFAELNLKVIPQMLVRYPDCVIGWSGHDSGIAMALLAYALGARIIEKHFTLNRANKGTDHAFSLEPAGMKKLVRDLERAHIALGDGVKRRYASEEAPLRKMAKSIVAAHDLPAGHVLQSGDLVCKSPGGGLPPYLLEQMLGFPLSRSLNEDECVQYADLGGAQLAAS